MGLREMPVPPSLKASTKVLEVLVLGSNHPSELIMSLLDKITKSGMLISSIYPEGGLLLLKFRVKKSGLMKLEGMVMEVLDKEGEEERKVVERKVRKEKQPR